MTKLDDGGPAFPLQSIGPEFSPGYSGMTLRDWFAGQAPARRDFKVGEAQALVGNQRGLRGSDPKADLAYDLSLETAYRYAYADAMLTARKKGPSDE